MNDENLKKGKKFSSEYQPAKNGRRPSKLKKYIKRTELSSTDITDTITMIMAMSKEELIKLQNDESQPMLIRVFIKSYLKDFEKGDLSNIEKLMDRAIGKAIQKQEIDLNANISVADEFRIVDADSKEA